VSSAVVVFLVCVAAATIAHLAILVSSVSTRARVNASESVPRPRVLVEFVWALIPILALALLFTATWERVRARERQPAETMRLSR
jgi:heme/copper-type cytochrome/quinol oxidase subunit 2